MIQVHAGHEISKHFLWKDALWLPKWNRMGAAVDGLTEEILDTLFWFFNEKMEKVREHIDAPVVAHVCWRPPAYNTLIGGAHGSAHLCPAPGVAALDFHVVGYQCDEVRIILEPVLGELGLRMEDLPTANWVHLDSRQVPPGGKRFFKP